MMSAVQIAAQTHSFDLEPGNASTTLREFARQAKVSVVMDRQDVQGVQTNEVSGLLLPRLALERMLEGTPLVFKEDLGTGAFAVTRSEIPSLDQATQNTEPKPIEETDMNIKKNNWLKTLAAVLTIGIAALSNQTLAQEDVDEEVYDLSPFTVDATEDTGYVATATLAGTRVRTDLKDLGAAISVYTQEFMEDTAATDAATLLSYTSNTEVGGNQGNFSGAEADLDNGGRFMQSDARTNPQLNQRIRGLGRADLTRGLFLTDIPFDSFNTDRVTVSRGPNSLLFGIGSPGGVIENSTKQAIHNSDFGELGLRFDNYGSWRAEFDYNKSIIEDRVALRISFLDENQEFKQEPAFENQIRLYAALDMVLFENKNNEWLDATKLRINREIGDQDGSPVEIIPPSVAYHGWFEPTPANIQQYSGIAPPPMVVSPSEGGSWQFQETYNPYAIRSEKGINTNSHQSWFRWIAALWDDNQNPTANLGTGDGLQGYQSLMTWAAKRGDTLDSTGLAGTPGVVAAFGADAPGTMPINSYIDFHSNSPYSEPFAIGFAVPTIQNRDVFDYRNKIYSGGVDRVEREFDATNFALDQSFFNNKLAVEIALDKQHYESYQDFLFTGSGGTSTTGPYDLYVSIVEYLPDGRPNPNLGRAYTRVGRPETRFAEINRETFRITAFGELDLTDKDGLLKWLGRHRITGLYNDHQRDNHSINRREAWVSNEFDVRAAVQQPTLNGARSTAAYVFFSSDSLLGVQSLDDVRINQINVPRPKPGDSYNVIYTDTSSANRAVSERTLKTGHVQVERYVNDEGISQTNIEAKAFAWQSYLFNENIVGLYGYREDDVEVFSRATDSELEALGIDIDSRDSLGRWNPQYTRLSKTPADQQTGDTTTWSIVARYPEDLLGDLPAGMDIQLHYSESENFNPVGLRNNALGQAVGQPTGTTEEYGFLVGFAENKFIVKANWYTTALNDVDAGPRVNVASEAYGRINSYRNADLIGRTFDNQLVTVTGDPAAFPIQDYETFYTTALNAVPSEIRAIVNPRKVDNELNDGIWDQIEWDNVPNLRSFQDRVAEGFEVELVANPTPGWRIMANISQQETVASNTASKMSAVVEAYTTNLQSTRLGELRRDASGDVATRTTESIWLSESVAEVRGAKALDGTKSNEQREWRYTVVSTYRFMEGKLRGFSVGGAARWESKAATGYVFELEPESGVPIPVVNKPFFDDGLFNGDLWVGYEKKLTDKIDWRVQLNVRNAFGDNDDIPVKTNPDGQVAVIRIPNPRTIYLSNTFKF
ncbi:MAG: TonB-dependent receptor plug domain-containing protein [Verrucomicrobia bacterium]|nr:TonB-dependent receptor plug domain-containing protein [Verrucomicrobiota bacterium]